MPITLKGKKDNIELKPSSSSIELKPSSSSIELKTSSSSIELKPSSSSIELQVPVSSGAVSSVNGQTGDVVIDVPSKVSELQNDTGYITESSIPSIPTKVSELQNDAGYLTEHQSLDALATKEALNSGLAAKQGKLTAGKNITIQNNVISASGGGSGEGGIIRKKVSMGFINTEAGWNENKDWLNDYTGKYDIYVDNWPIIGDYWENRYNSQSKRVLYYCHSRNKMLKSIWILYDWVEAKRKYTLAPYSQQQTYETTEDILITNQNWQSYISVSGGSDWNITTSIYEGNLYNAKEVVIFWQDAQSNHHQTYLNVGSDYSGNNGNTWGSSNWMNTSIYLDNYDEYNGAYISYDGNAVNTSNCSIDAICYKT